jgi:hypothetical protein
VVQDLDIGHNHTEKVEHFVVRRKLRERKLNVLGMIEHQQRRLLIREQRQHIKDTTISRGGENENLSRVYC